MTRGAGVGDGGTVTICEITRLVEFKVTRSKVPELVPGTSVVASTSFVSLLVKDHVGGGFEVAVLGEQITVPSVTVYVDALNVKVLSTTQLTMDGGTGLPL